MPCGMYEPSRGSAALLLNRLSYFFEADGPS